MNRIWIWGGRQPHQIKFLNWNPIKQLNKVGSCIRYHTIEMRKYYQSYTVVQQKTIV